MYRGTKEQNNTIINLRPITCAALGMAAGAAFCYAFLYFNVSVALLVLLCLAPLLLVPFIPQKRYALICWILYIFFLISGMGGMYLQLHAYDTQNFEAGEYLAEGQVNRVELYENGKYAVTLDHVFLNGDKADGNVILYVQYGRTSLQEGDVVQTTVKIDRMQEAFRFGSLRVNTVRNNVKYFAYLSKEPHVLRHNFKPFAMLNSGLKQLLFDNMDPQSAGLAFAMTTGDTTFVESGVLTSARYGGVAHVFAISGLHIGILFAGMGMLLRKIRLPEWVKIFLSVGVGFVFCGVCNFTPSSVRALIICSVTLLTRRLHFGSDSVENASLAALIILLVSPVNLFSAGFLLSFSAYLGVTVLSPQMVRYLGHGWHQLPFTWVKQGLERLTTIFAVQVCILPVQLLYFGYASLWGVVLNFFLLPLFSLFFPFLLVLILLSALLPFASQVLLTVASGGLDVFTFFFQITDFSGVFLYGFTFSAVAVVAYVAMLFFASGKLNVNKAPLVLFLIALIMVDTLLTSLHPADFKVMQMSYYNDFCAALVQTEDTNVLIVNGKIPTSRVQLFLREHTTQKVDAVIVAAEKPMECINSLLDLDFDELYVYAPMETGLQTHTVTAQKQFTLGGVKYSYHTKTWLTFSYRGAVVSYGEYFPDVDHIIFPQAERDGLIFSVKDGILLTNGS